MLNVRICINVFSTENPWIDFCIALQDENDFPDAMKIIKQAYDEWFSSDNATDLPIADYISGKLIDASIWHDIYFLGKEEEDFE